MKKLLAFLSAIILAGSLCSCQSIILSPGTEAGAISFTDALGYSVQVRHPQKVAALMGSFAETWLLAGGRLAAVTDDALSEGRVKPDAGLTVAGSVKSPDVELLIANDIDFAILSANISGQVALRSQLEDAGITTAYFDVETFDAYLAMLKICTDITGRKDLYEANGVAVQAQIDAAVAKKTGRQAPAVLFIRAYSTGAKAKNSANMTGAMLKDLGCVNIADSNKSLLEDLSLEQIILDDPDYIFVTTMGASDDAALAALAAGIQANPAWQDLTAVREGRYFVLPGDLFHEKPNNRWGESYATLARILYGD